MSELTAFTAEELETLQHRIDDPDWDISQQADVYEMLPRLLELAKNSMMTVCAYCGQESPRDAAAILDHIMSCEKRPEKTFLNKAFEVEADLRDRLTAAEQERDGLREAVVRYEDILSEMMDNPDFKLSDYGHERVEAALSKGAQS